ncbi:MAG: hypothetical protein ACRENO_04790 [Thermodesulfobacteriota bacterium]
MKKENIIKDKLVELNEMLEDSAKKLDLCSKIINDLGFNSTENLYKIGDSLKNIFLIQHQIFEILPELKPDFLNKRNK